MNNKKDYLTVSAEQIRAAVKRYKRRLTLGAAVDVWGNQVDGFTFFSSVTTHSLYEAALRHAEKLNNTTKVD